MTWFRVDDGFYDHPKVDALFDQPETAALAVAVWTLAGAWASRHLTDGHVPRRVLRRLLPGVSATDGAEALVRVGLWEQREDGWVFTDWAAWNPLRDEVEEKRAGSRQRAKKSNERRKAAAQNTADAPQLRDGYAASAAPRPVPTVPDPTRPDPNPSTHTHLPVSESGETPPAWTGKPPVPPGSVTPTPLVTSALQDVLRNTDKVPTPEGGRRLRVPASFEPERVGPLDEVLEELCTASARVSAGQLDLSIWRGNMLLTPNGYDRMVGENAAWLKRQKKNRDPEGDDAEARRQAGEELKVLMAEEDAREAEERNQ